MANTNVTIRLDETLKKQAENLFSELGINMTTAMTIFLKKAVREQGIPFEVSVKTGTQSQPSADPPDRSAYPTYEAYVNEKLDEADLLAERDTTRYTLEQIKEQAEELINAYR